LQNKEYSKKNTRRYIRVYRKFISYSSGYLKKYDEDKYITILIIISIQHKINIIL
jgi:hypothetical protein